VHLIAGAMASDQFQFPVVIQPRTYAWAALCVVGAGAGQRAGGAPAHRPAGHGGGAEDTRLT
jgi:hypothetical protein